MIEPLVDAENLTLSEARVKYHQVHEEFERVRGNYSGFFGWFKRDMADGDVEILKRCVSVLEPLALSGAVHTDVNRRARYNDTLHNRIRSLSNEILYYAGRFKNTDVYFAGMKVDEVA